MKNLREKVLNLLSGNGKADGVLDELSDYREKLAKNISSPLFSKNAKNKMLKMSNELYGLEKTLYRYNVAKQSNRLSDAKEELENAQNIVLKGGISNVRYIWRSEYGENTCDECLSLDGEEFDLYDDIPPMPHPNCRCYIEIVEDDNSNDNNDVYEEPCDCWDKIDEIYNEANNYEVEINSCILDINYMQNEVMNWHNNILEKINTVNILKEEIANMQPCSENCVAITGFATNVTNDTELLEKVRNIVKNNQSAIETLEIFEKNKKQMEADVEQIHIDKYYHSKANCEAAELGAIQALWAIIWSIGKEIKDYYKKVFKDHKDAYEIFIDCSNDLKADILGLCEARNHGACSEKVKKVENIFRKKSK